MIKDFETYIKEGRMGRLVNADVLGDRKQDKLTEDEVRSYIQSNFNENCKKVTIRYEGNQPIVDIEGDFSFREDITEIPFQFGKVTGSFDCGWLDNLISLKGCPQEVGGGFLCNDCDKLTSLEGCPKKVGGDFICSYCSNLTSLEGCPKKVGGNFNCWSCGRKFTEDEVRSMCDVKKRVIV